MKNQVRWWVLAVAVMGALWVIGCGQRESKSSSPGAASQQPTAQQPAPTGEAAEQEGAGAKVTPAGSVGEIWTQIASEQKHLSDAIQNGQLKDVHHLAFGIRDLVVALVDKASASSPGSAPKLKGLVEQVNASAGKLDETGDAGNLSGTQAEFARLNAVLGSIKTATLAK